MGTAHCFGSDSSLRKREANKEFIRTFIYPVFAQLQFFDGVFHMRTRSLLAIEVTERNFLNSGRFF